MRERSDGRVAVDEQSSVTWLETSPSIDERELSPSDGPSDLDHPDTYSNVGECQEEMEEDERAPAIGALPFCQLVRAITTQIDPSLNWKYEAVQALHEGAEDALVHLFHMSLNQARLASRDVVMCVVREVLAPRRVIHLDPPEDGIDVSGFQTEVRQLLGELGLGTFEWEEGALEILRQAAEDHAVEIFEKSNAMAHQAGESTVGLNEYRCCSFILGRRK